MSRGFFGGGGLGRGKNPFAKKGVDLLSQFSKRRQRSMKELVEDKNTHKVKGHREMVEDALDDRLFNPRKSSMSFKIGGTVEEEKHLSKGYLKALDIAKNKRLKEKAAKRDKKVKIAPKQYRGGLGDITDKGHIRDKKGNIIFKVNLETGVITDSMGMKVGKYKPFAFSNDGKIEKLLEKYSKKVGFGTANIGLDLFGGKKDT